MRSGVIAAALRTMNGPEARPESRWTARAASSLPDPDGPEIITRLLVGATFSIIWRRWFIAADRPISSDASPERSRSVWTSLRSCDASSARSAIRTSRSALKGFSI